LISVKHINYKAHENVTLANIELIVLRLVKQATKDKKRLGKLKEILATLESGQDVANRTLKTWMSDDFDCIAMRWDYYQQMKEEFQDKPGEIKQYDLYLKKALFAYNRKAYIVAERKFEIALEYLQEIVARDKDLIAWFDRDTEWCVENNIGPDPLQMPRVVTSRSLDNLHLKNRPKKIDVKIGCVESAIDVLENPIPEMTEAQTKKLKRLLNNIKNKR